MKQTIKLLKRKIERYENASNKLKQALEVLEGGDVAAKDGECYLRQFCANDEVHRELVERLKKHDVYELYIEEHKKQTKTEGFGKYGKMLAVHSSKSLSGMTWCQSSQGEYFWGNILCG